MTAFKTPLHKRQSGFSIVEVMVALFISLIMLAAVITVFVNTRQSFLFQQGVNALNDNIRFAIQTMSHDLRMAGHWAGATAGPKFSDIDDQAAKDKLENCIGFSPHLADMITNDRPLYGISITSQTKLTPSAVRGSGYCGAQSGFVVETDILTVNYARPEIIPDAAISSEQIMQRTRVGFPPRLFIYQSNIAASYGTGHELENAFNLPLISRIYAVSKCEYLYNTSGVCTGQRNLLRTSSTPGSGSGVPEYSNDLVATGVEAMSFLMMVDSNRDGNDVRFMNATELLANTNLGDNPFDAVKAVHISMVVRSETRSISLQGNPPYRMPGADYAYIPEATDSTYSRRLVTSTVQLRNNK